MTPWLSVIIPVHMGAHYLPATLASAAAERPDGVEFRIYASGEDGGAARRAAAPFLDSMAIIWEDVPPALTGWTAKTNKGVRDARADHIVMLHQDDLWLPGHLAAVRAAIAAWPEAMMSIAPSRFAAADGRLLSAWRLPFAPGLHDGRSVRDVLLVQNSIAIPSPVIRRDAWLAVGGMTEDLWYSADWDLYLKLAEAGPIAVRREVTTAFRLHGGSLTMTGSANVADYRDQLQRVFERHARTGPAIAPRLDRQAQLSIAINCALAAAAKGDRSLLPGALLSLLRLGPVGMAAYIRNSRIIDRIIPRLRLVAAKSN
jgi:hypothetical protein